LAETGQDHRWTPKALHAEYARLVQTCRGLFAQSLLMIAEAHSDTQRRRVELRAMLGWPEQYVCLAHMARLETLRRRVQVALDTIQ
jgi:hypothetical protein